MTARGSVSPGGPLCPGQAEESVYEITTRPLTAEEREAARLTWLESINSASPSGELGCYVAYTGAWGVAGFGGGFLIGLVAAAVMGRLDDWWRFGLWFGAIAAAVSAAVTIRGHVMMAIESRRRARRLAADAEDFGEVAVIRCEAEAAARCSHEKLIDGPVCALSVGGGALLVLRGAYVDDLCDEEGFPHESFEIEVNLRALVLNYEPSGKRLLPRSIDYGACDERERAALGRIPDQGLLRGTIETCVADIVRHLAL